MQTSLQSLLDTGQPIVADGGMGSMLIAQGLRQGEPPELWNVEHPERVRQIHRDYLEAGAQIILTNSFGGNRIRLGRSKLAERAEELNRAAAELARAEADAINRMVVVGGSMGPTGEMLEPYGELPFDDAVAAFEEQARALVAGGVDVLWIETMADLEELRAAVEGARRAAPEMPLVTTMTFDTNGRTMMGVTPEKAITALREHGVIALGANCGNGPDEIEGVIEQMRAVDVTIPLVAKANAGLPRMEDDRPVYDATPQEMGEYAGRVRDQGAQIIGACCGSTPAHIAAIAAALKS
ncbi:MAG: betaine--homocysteine S-methyltransferase [Chloroflexi bacterium]|nr:betaine--homocysteine S-methyltransferase [Chloroflexota bacterium]